MSLVITRERSSQLQADTVLDRAIRLVPLEVVSLYVVFVIVARGAVVELELVLMVAGAVLAPAVLEIHARRQRETVSLAQHVVRMLSFVAWCFVVANPLAPGPPVPPWIPAVSIVMVPAIGTMLFPPSGLS